MYTIQVLKYGYAIVKNSKHITWAKTYGEASEITRTLNTNERILKGDREMNERQLKLAKALLLELEALQGATLGYTETLSTVNRALNDARELASLVKQSELKKAA